MDKKINVPKVLSTFDEAINTLEKKFQPELLTGQEQLNVDKALKEVIRLGLKVKLQYQQRKIEVLIRSLESNQDIDLIKLQLMSNELEKVLKMNDAA